MGARWCSTTRATGSARTPTWARWWSASTASSVCCTRLRSCARAPGGGDRPLVPGAADEWWRRASRPGARPRSRSRPARRVVAAARRGFAVSPLPTAALCLTCPGRAGLCSWDEDRTMREDPALQPASADAVPPAARGGRRRSLGPSKMHVRRWFRAPRRCYAFPLRLRCPPACARGYARKVDVPIHLRGMHRPREHFHDPHNMQPPKAVGLYDLRFEHDACGVGMVARLDNTPTHEVAARAITALENLEHRGRLGRGPVHGRRRGHPRADARRAAARGARVRAAAGGRVRRADVLPADRRGRRASLKRCSSAPCAARASGCSAGATCRSTRSTRERSAAAACPVIRQLFVGRGRAQKGDQDAFERKLYVIRRISELEGHRAWPVRDLSSSRTINYKGMLISSSS